MEVIPIRGFQSPGVGFSPAPRDNRVWMGRLYGMEDTVLPVGSSLRLKSSYL